MSELILHAAHLSEEHQLRFTYLFDVAAKRWSESQPTGVEKHLTELWVVDAQSPPEAISQRPDSACVLMIATDDQATRLRMKWPHLFDSLLPPDYSVNRLAQALEQLSMHAKSKQLRETLKNRRMQVLTTAHGIQVKNADAAFLKATDLSATSFESPSALHSPISGQAAATEALPATDTRYRIKRWTQLTGSMSGRAYKQALAILISGERTQEALCTRSGLGPAELSRLLQLLRGKGLLIEIEPPANSMGTPEPAGRHAMGLMAAAPHSEDSDNPSLARNLFRQLSRWIGQSRGNADKTQA